MKTETFLLKLLLFAAVLILGFISCRKPIMNPGGEIQFTSLSAGNYTLSQGASTKIIATVQNDCPEISYNWSVSSGNVSGTNKEVTFNAPNSVSQITVNCTVTHPGRDPKTKSITITVQ